MTLGVSGAKRITKTSSFIRGLRVRSNPTKPFAIQGNFDPLGLSSEPNSTAISARYPEIPYVSRTGNFFGLTGNLIGPSGNFRSNQAIRLRPLVWNDLRCRDNFPASPDRAP